MSLKDRLNTQTKTIKAEKKELEPVYYPTSEVSQGINSLGEIDTLFADDEINSIYVMGAKNIYIERKGKKSKISLQYRDNVRLENIIKKNAQFHGIELNELHPYIEFNHKLGINICATLPPLSSCASIIVKCYKDKFANLQTLTEIQALSKEMALLIEVFASQKLNIIIAGEKNTLKTTLLSAISKKVPMNYNASLIDYSKELHSELQNVTSYDFKNYKNDELLDYIFNSNPDKVFVNDPDDFSIYEKYLNQGYKGLCAVINANDAIEILNKPYSKNIDIVIFTKKKDQKRLVSSISLVKNNELKNIFYLNENLEHNSSGIIPDFYDNIEQSVLPVSSAIFEADYKHTYYKNPKDDILNAPLKKNLNPEILKKFKKEMEVLEESQTIEENEQNL